MMHVMWNYIRTIISHLPSINSALQGCQFLNSVTIVHSLAVQLGKILPILLLQHVHQ